LSITIRLLERSSGTRSKAILRDRSGRALRSRTFSKLTLAREWAKRIEADREVVAALGTEVARSTLADIVRGDPPRRAPLVVPQRRQWQVGWWLDRLSGRLLAGIAPDDIRLALNGMAEDEGVRFHDLVVAAKQRLTDEVLGELLSNTRRSR
jgi:hypothetical protein